MFLKCYCKRRNQKKLLKTINYDVDTTNGSSVGVNKSIRPLINKTNPTQCLKLFVPAPTGIPRRPLPCYYYENHCIIIIKNL